MAAATPYYRIPVVIFAVLVGGLYVYAKGGGQLMQRQPVVSLPANSQGEELAPPRIEFMMGPKSAPAFCEPPAKQPVPQQPAPPTNLLPGSKSRAIIDPPPVYFPKNAPNGRVQPRVVPRQEAQPVQRGNPPPSRILPGSKSAILIEPSSIVPQPSNTNTNAQQAQPQPATRQPAYQQPAYQQQYQQPYQPQRGVSR